MSVTATGGAPTTADEPRPTDASGLRALLIRLLMGSPDLVVCAVAGFSIGPMILLLAGHFTPAPVLVTGVLGAALALRARGLDPELPDRRSLMYTALAAGGIAVWFVVNCFFTAEDVYATRDPATYDITARWLMSHATLHIATQPQVFGAGATNCANLTLASYCNGGAGFSPVNATQVYAQGNHLMPVFGAVAGWLFGVPGLFRANLVLGALALLVLFGLVRRVAGAPLALLATAAMAVSIPMLYVSRDTYSEPLMMLFLVGSVSLLHRAIRSGRLLDFALAGVVAGCSAMVRIDSYAALLAIILSAVVITGIAAPGLRRAAAGRALALVGAAVVPTLLGWLDLTHLSYGYYRDTRSNVLLEEKAAVALAVVGLVAIAIVWRPPVRRWLVTARTRGRVSSVLTYVLVAAFAFLASRPLWQVTHQALVNKVLEGWQRNSGVHVDGTLTYNQTTLNLIGAYMSWVTIVLAVAGYAMLLRTMVRRRDYALMGILAMGLMMSALYLWSWEITPDQPWAMRRYVPVVLPLMLMAAVVGLQGLRGLRVRTPRARRVVRVVGVLAAATMVVYPAVVTAPVAGIREEVPQYSQVQAMCAAVGSDGAVIELDQASLSTYSQTLRSYCDVPSIGLVATTAAQAAAIPAQLAQARATAAAQGRRLYVIALDRDAIPFAPSSATTAFSSVRTQRWPNIVGRPPSKPGHSLVTVYLGAVGADGRVSAVSPR